ncbi:MAG: hypothetical protein OXG50_00270 [bacterium]|nr:hypothetical protein [bacterium]
MSEVERVELVSRLADAIGEEATETLMKCVLPDGRDQLATKADVKVFEAETKVEFASMRAEMETEFAEVRAEMETGFAKVRAEFATIRAEMETGFAEVRAEFRSEFAKQTRRHYGSMVIFIASVWGVLIPQIFV